MASIGLLFPGQGAQYVGMGKDLAEKFVSAKNTFERGNQTLGFDLAKICFEGPENVLTDTANAQPAIFVTSMAALEVLKEVHPEKKISLTCGLSAGEFSALVACGSISFESALKLVRKRGELMSDAAKNHPGTMASVIGLNYEQCLEVCKKSGAELANINSPTQLVLSGTKEAIEKAGELAKKAGAKKIIALKVSGAFHSSLMHDAQVGLEKVLESVKISKPKEGVDFIANVSGEKVCDSEAIRSGLAKQVVSSVQWVHSIETAKRLGIKKFFEVGPGAVLAGLVGRIDKSLHVSPWGTVEDVFEQNNHPVESTV